MNCPNCGTPNDPNSHFCVNCGQTLTQAPNRSTAVSPLARSQRHLLAIATVRLVIALLLVWLLRSVILSLSFVEGLRLPGVPFPVETLVTLVVYVVALILLLNYAQSLGSLWPRAFPRVASLAPALTALIYVLALSAAYSALVPLITTLVDDPVDFILVLRIAFLVLALGLLGWAGWIVYDSLPRWLSSIRFDVPAVDRAEIACLNCGYLNPSTNDFCGHCGHAITGQALAPAASD